MHNIGWFDYKYDLFDELNELFGIEGVIIYRSNLVPMFFGCFPRLMATAE